MKTTPQELARQYVYKTLPTIVNLRKMEVKDLQSTAFRSEASVKIRDILRGHTEHAPLASDPQFIERLLCECLGLGALDDLLQDPQVTEIMVNGCDEIFVERHGLLERSSATFANEEQLRGIISRIVSPLGRRVDESCPMVDARLPDGSRFNAVLPPLSLKGPVLTIRKFSKSFLHPDDLIRQGSITPSCLQFLKISVERRKNILVSGGTGAGKTTLLNMLSSFIPKNERIITLEDSAELKLQQPHVIPLESRPQNIEGRGRIDIRDLLRNALRMRPDRILVGECRGEEAIDMLQAMNTGHDGSMTTLHANSAREALSRLETLVLLSGCSWPLRAIRQQIASSIDLVVQLRRDRQGKRVVSEVLELCNTEGDIFVSQPIFFRPNPEASLAWSKNIPRFFQDLSPELRALWTTQIFRDTP